MIICFVIFFNINKFKDDFILFFCDIGIEKKENCNGCKKPYSLDKLVQYTPFFT